jgi:hypothetical protein
MILHEASTDIDEALASQQRVEYERARQVLVNKNLSALQMAIAARITYGLDIAGKGALAYYATILGQERVHQNSAQRAATKLWESGLIQRTGAKRGYVSSSTHISAILRERFPELADPD